MDLADVVVHPWTRAWWDTLPDQYRALDAVQESPIYLRQVGFNADPLFTFGFDGWDVTAADQTSETVGVRMTRTFTGLERFRPVYFRVWWRDPDAGSDITVRLYGALNTLLAESVYTDLVGETGYVEVDAVVPNSTDAAVTAEIVFSGPVADGVDGLVTIDAVNIGYTQPAYNALPGVAGAPTFPMLRWMNGIGAIVGQVREVSDLMWSGDFTAPGNTPDYALRWLAQLMGVPKKQRDIEPAPLREYLLDVLAQGRPVTGNRQSIADAAKRFLMGSRQVSVIPSPTVAHTIMVLVRPDEAPDGLPAVVAGIKSTGVVPAGHDLQAVYGGVSWDAYEAALGATWDEADAARTTWTVADSLGVALE